jgi:translation initiation factor 1A
MTKKNSKGGKKHKKDKNSDTDKELVLKEDGQEYGQVIELCGDKRVRINCFDGCEIQARIRGCFKKKKIFITRDDIVLISTRGLDDDKYDIIKKYNGKEIRMLQKLEEIPNNLKLNDNFVEEVVIEKKDNGLYDVEDLFRDEETNGQPYNVEQIFEDDDESDRDKIDINDI